MCRYWYAQSLNTIINIVMKMIVSRPRPHFQDTCRPDWDRIDCQANNGSVREILVTRHYFLIPRIIHFEPSLCQISDSELSRRLIKYKL